MAKTGPKSKPRHLKSVNGTDQPCRAQDVAFEVPDGEATLPAQFEGLRDARPQFAAIVLDIWNAQIDKYRQRGQSTAGYANALYQMCLLEAQIHVAHQNGSDVPQSWVNGLRIYYTEFYDTPASNMKPTSSAAGNKFANNGKPGAS